MMSCRLRETSRTAPNAFWPSPRNTSYPSPTSSAAIVVSPKFVSQTLLALALLRHCERSEAIQGSFLDCFVALHRQRWLLAMTAKYYFSFHLIEQPIEGI